MWTLLAIGCLLLVLAVRLVHWLESRATLPALHARHVLVTGCDSGFGRRLALRLDSLGCRVFAACLTSASARHLSSETSERVRTVLMDVTNDDDIERAVREVEGALPDKTGLWAIVNNAGIMGPVVASEMMTRKDFLALLQVNLLGMTQVTRMFLPLVRRERGRIVNITSAMGRFAIGAGPYVASKFAAVGYTDTLRRELYHHGITVHSIEPGAYLTNLLDDEVLRQSATRVFSAASPYAQRVYGEDYVDNLMKSMGLFKRHLASTNPEEVVDAYVHALTSKRPSTSYVVGRNGNFFYRPLWMLPTCVSDWIVTRDGHTPKHLS